MADIENTTQEMLDEPMTGTEEGLFDDFDFDEPEAEGADTDEATEAEEPQLYTVKYNGQEQQLTMEQLIEHAQKGMNYDKVKGERDSVREGNIYKAMKVYADKSGMSVEDAARYLLDTEAADAELAEEKSIKDQYGNLPNELIKELVASRTAGKRRSVESAAEAKEQAEWGKALEAYPDLTMDTVPEEVLKAVAAGESPLMALRKNEIAQLRAQLKEKDTEQQNNINRARSVGSVKSTASAVKDPFLAGLGL